MTEFGKEVYCLDSLQTGRYVTGRQVLAQRCYHRLITPRGMLRGGDLEKNFGFDLTTVCGMTAPADAEKTIGQQIINELQKEDAVESVEPTVVASVTGAETTWTIDVRVQSALGPFRMVLGISDVSIELLELDTA